MKDEKEASKEKSWDSQMDILKQVENDSFETKANNYASSQQNLGQLEFVKFCNSHRYNYSCY